MVSMDDVEKIKSLVPLEDVVAETIVLKPAGRNRLKGLCPFHNEKTPSFFVDVTKGLYRCFGCEESGDIFNFVQKTQNLDFKDALELLAKRAGVELEDDYATSARRPKSKTASRPEPDTQATEPPRSALWIDELVTQAHEALVKGESETACAGLAYFQTRGLGALVEALRLGVIDESIKVPQAGRALDRYRGRAVVPTLEGDQAIWFKARDLSGRAADELKTAGVNKYDGPSGSTPAPFNPAGLEHAREAGFLILCEGEIDGASLLAAYGLNYPVMGLPGGNLPQGWADKIADAGVPVYLALDPDDAGARHTERLQTVLSGLGVRCYRVNLTADLNELLCEHGESLPEQFNAALETAALESTSDLLYIRETWLTELDARANRPHAAYTTGLGVIDDLLSGGYLEGLHLLGGITGGGKTSLALQIATHNALAGRPVIFASYEQSRLELWGRVASCLTSVPYTAIKLGTYDDHGQKLLTSSVLKSDAAWSKLEAVSKYLKIVEGGDALSRSKSAYTVEVLATTARGIADQHGAPPLVIVDYVQRLPAPPELKIRDVRERVGYAAGLLQVNLAREIGCPVLALSSIGRMSYRLGELDLEQRLAALKEAGELEYTAYTTMLIYNLPDELQTSMDFTPGIMSNFRSMCLDIVKNREGEIGRCAVQWKPARGVWNKEKLIKERSR